MKKKIFYFFLLAITSLIPFAIRYKIWQINFLIPFSYNGDIMWNLVSIKTFIETGWHVTNNSLGAPFGYNIIDYPLSDLLHLLFIKFLSLFINNAPLILNIFYIFTFVSTFLTSFFVLKHFKIRSGLSIVGAYLFTYLPFHLIRGENHLFLSSYFMIPPIAMVIYWIMDKKSISFKNIFNKKTLLSIVIALLISSTGIYYAFFSAVFLLFAGVVGSIQYRQIRNIFAAVVISFIILGGVLINIYPNILHQISYGRTQAVGRSPTEAEYYGLKIIGLFIPNSSYRISILRKFQVKYMTYALTKDEGGTSYLGIFGIIGFFILLINLIKKIKFDAILDNISYLNLWGILFATVSGFAIFFTYIVSENIRVYQRISIFIAFFCISAFIFVLNKLLSKIKVKKYLYFLIVFIITVVGLIDQTAVYIPEPRIFYKDFLSDKKFVGQIESVVAKDTMILQLPYKAFPETPPVHALGDYDLFRSYLHSHNLKWSYGTTKGTSQDQWLKNLSELPVEQMVKTAAVGGYGGIYFNTAGYEDKGKQIEQKLSSILDKKPVKSDTKDQVFFSLTDYKQKLIKQYGREEIERQREKILTLPLSVNWNTSFYPEEKDDQDNWHWSKKQSSLIIVNDNENTKNVILEFYAVSNYPELSNLYINGDLFSKHLRINGQRQLFKVKLKIPPGAHKISFKTDSKKVSVPTEARDLYFRLFNFKLKET